MLRAFFVSMFFFFFKQKTAYEMRISDWSSDVCSSDLLFEQQRRLEAQCALDRLLLQQLDGGGVEGVLVVRLEDEQAERLLTGDQIGRASCRERVCQYV